MLDIPLDFSALSKLYCRRAYQLACVRGIDQSGPAAMFGNAVHKYQELKAKHNTNGVLATCSEIAARYNTDLSKLVTVCATLDTQFQFPPPDKDTTDELLIEYKFSIPYMEVGKYRIVLCGTIDRLYMPADILIFQDWKTCAATGAAANKKMMEYVTSFQLPFYLYIVHKYLHQFLAPKMAEAARNLRIRGHYTMIYHSILPPKIEDSPSVFITEADIIHIEHLIQYAISKIIPIHEATALEPPEGTLYKLCPQCSFNSICAIKDHDRLLATINSLPTRIYDPTNFR